MWRDLDSSLVSVSICQNWKIESNVNQFTFNCNLHCKDCQRRLWHTLPGQVSKTSRCICLDLRKPAGTSTPNVFA